MQKCSLFLVEKLVDLAVFSPDFYMTSTGSWLLSLRVCSPFFLYYSSSSSLFFFLFSLYWILFYFLWYPCSIQWTKRQLLTPISGQNKQNFELDGSSPRYITIRVFILLTWISFFPVTSWKLLFLMLNYSWFTIQCSVIFCSTAKWFSYTFVCVCVCVYIYIYIIFHCGLS